MQCQECATICRECAEMC
ncbi:four-helix bundle copper-binding protein [Ferdinandcohnia sp. SAFN-114]